jgi:hypothetical protein
LGNSFTAIAHAELAVDVLEVGLHGVDGDAQRLRDLPIGQAFGEQMQNFKFALAQRLNEWLSNWGWGWLTRVGFLV